MRVPLPFGSFWFRFCFFFYKSEQKREARHTHTAKKKHKTRRAGRRSRLRFVPRCCLPRRVVVPSHARVFYRWAAGQSFLCRRRRRRCCCRCCCFARLLAFLQSTSTKFPPASGRKDSGETLRGGTAWGRSPGCCRRRARRPCRASPGGRWRSPWCAARPSSPRSCPW